MLVHATTFVTPLSIHNWTEPSIQSLISIGWMKWGKKIEPITPSLSPNVDSSSIEVDTITTVPSDVPSTLRSDTPSSIPSDMPSSFPSDTQSATPSDVLSMLLRDEAPSAVPSDSASSSPSDTPSTVPSDIPSILFSDTPSGLSSDTPSNTLSSIPTISTGTTFNEDAVQLGLETLDLVGYSNIQSWTNGDNDKTSKVLTNGSEEYKLDNLLPYTDLFDPQHYYIDGSRITNIRSNETFQIPIYRSMTTDGTIIQFATNELGNISFAEIRVPDPSLNDDIFYIPSDILRAGIGEDATTEDGDRTDVLISFTSRDLDKDKFGTIFDLDEVELPIESGVEGVANTTTAQVQNSRNRHVRRMLYDTSISESAANTDDAIVATICSQYQIVKIAVVYDSSLCSTYGSMAATRNRIINIVASASLYYEREICTKLQLVDIYTPDTTCSSSSSASFTNQFNTASACRGENNLLSDFSSWIRQRRNAIGIDSNAIVHLLTGADKVTSTIGCAFTSSVRYLGRTK